MYIYILYINIKLYLYFIYKYNFIFILYNFIKRENLLLLLYTKFEFFRYNGGRIGSQRERKKIKRKIKKLYNG